MQLVEKLEIHYLANQGSQFYFALLTDFADARAEGAERRRVIAAALEGIERLNARYGPDRQKDASAAPVSTCFIVVASGTTRKTSGSVGNSVSLEEFNRLLQGAKTPVSSLPTLTPRCSLVFVTSSPSTSTRDCRARAQTGGDNQAPSQPRAARSANATRARLRHLAAARQRHA